MPARTCGGTPMRVARSAIWAPEESGIRTRSLGAWGDSDVARVGAADCWAPAATDAFDSLDALARASIGESMLCSSRDMTSANEADCVDTGAENAEDGRIEAAGGGLAGHADGADWAAEAKADAEDTLDEPTS